MYIYTYMYVCMYTHYISSYIWKLVHVTIVCGCSTCTCKFFTNSFLSAASLSACVREMSQMCARGALQHATNLPPSTHQILVANPAITNVIKQKGKVSEQKYTMF